MALGQRVLLLVREPDAAVGRLGARSRRLPGIRAANGVLPVAASRRQHISQTRRAGLWSAPPRDQERNVIHQAPSSASRLLHLRLVAALAGCLMCLGVSCAAPPQEAAKPAGSARQSDYVLLDRKPVAFMWLADALEKGDEVKAFGVLTPGGPGSEVASAVLEVPDEIGGVPLWHAVQVEYDSESVETTTDRLQSTYAIRLRRQGDGLRVASARRLDEPVVRSLDYVLPFGTNNPLSAYMNSIPRVLTSGRDATAGATSSARPLPRTATRNLLMALQGDTGTATGWVHWVESESGPGGMNVFMTLSVPCETDGVSCYEVIRLYGDKDTLVEEAPGDPSRSLRDVPRFTHRKVDVSFTRDGGILRADLMRLHQGPDAVKRNLWE